MSFSLPTVTCVVIEQVDRPVPEAVRIALPPCCPRLQLARVDKNGPVRLRVAGSILLPHALLNSRPVFPEHFDLVTVLSPEIVVQGFSADGAPHPAVSILPEEENDL